MSYASAVDLIAMSRGRTRTGIQIITDRVVQRQIDRIGNVFLETPGDARSIIEMVDGDITAFGKELHDEVVNSPGYPHSDPRPPLEAFFGSVWSPFVQNWEAWKAKNDGWWTNFWAPQSHEAEQYREQLITLREEASKLGMVIASPEPGKPPPGLVESVTGGVASLLKSLIWVGVSVLGFILLLRWIG